jgi:hypothetical protein
MHKKGQEYTYSPDAKAAYVKYSNEIADTMNKQWKEGNISGTNLSKDRRNLNRYSTTQFLLKTVAVQVWITEILQPHSFCNFHLP